MLGELGAILGYIIAGFRYVAMIPTARSGRCPRSGTWRSEMLNLLLLLFIGASGEIQYGSYCHAVEVNHVVDSNGNDRFTQLIYRDSAGLICDWRYLQCQAMVPDRMAKTAVWRENGHWRMLRCSVMYETWTRTDPERDEAQWRPASLRRLLFRTADRVTE